MKNIDVYKKILRSFWLVKIHPFLLNMIVRIILLSKSKTLKNLSEVTTDLHSNSHHPPIVNLIFNSGKI